METLVQCRSCGEDNNRADWEAAGSCCAHCGETTGGTIGRGLDALWRYGDGWNWSWSGDRLRPMRSPLGLLAAVAGAGCAGVSLGSAWMVPELSILAAVAAAFWWQIARVA